MKKLLKKTIEDMQNASNGRLDKSLFEDETALFKLINGLKAFPKSIENSYLRSLNIHFLESSYNSVMLLFAILVSTVFTDIFVFNASIFPILTKLLLITGLFSWCYLIISGKTKTNLINTVTIMVLLAQLQLLISCISLPTGLDKLYTLGFFVVMLGSIIIFRLSYKHLYVCSLFVVINQALLQLFVFNFFSEIKSVEQLFSDVSVLVFMATICLIIFGVLSAQLGEKANRTDWLKSQLLSLEKRKQNQLMIALKRRALTDGLTKIFNRRFFDKKFDQYWDKHSKAHQPISIIMIDVDWFKKYNDNYGHQKGDECLKQVSQTLLKAVKDYNIYNKADNNGLASILARYGGEEFIILFPNSLPKKATYFAQKLVEDVFKKRLFHEYSPLGFCSVSIGVATVNRPSAKDKAIAMARLVKEADDALYEAKKQGKNRVVSASEINSITIEQMMHT